MLSAVVRTSFGALPSSSVERGRKVIGGADVADQQLTPKE